MSLIRSAAQRLARPLALRAISTSTPTNVLYRDKEQAEESIAFRKEDERLLRQLLTKIKKQADKVDVHEAEGTNKAELEALKAIVGKYNVSEPDLQALVAWKHSSA